jgi:hypothetical protein
VISVAEEIEADVGGARREEAEGVVLAEGEAVELPHNSEFCHQRITVDLLHLRVAYTKSHLWGHLAISKSSVHAIGRSSGRTDNIALQVRGEDICDDGHNCCPRLIPLTALD